MARFIEQFPVGHGKVEKIDKTPHSLLTQLKAPKSLEQIVQEMLHFNLQKIDTSIEPETFEESIDFGDESELADYEKSFYNLKDDDIEHARYWAEKPPTEILAVPQATPENSATSEGSAMHNPQQSNEPKKNVQSTPPLASHKGGRGDVGKPLDDLKPTDTGTQNGEV